MEGKACDTLYVLYHVQLIVNAVYTSPVTKWKFRCLDVYTLQAVAEDRVVTVCSLPSDFS
jgi:hypothetical protein